MKSTWMAVFVVGLLASSGAWAAEKPRVPHVMGVVNLNQAGPSELHLLPGVGAKAAQSIVDYRKQHPFTRAEELVKVKGFGKRRFERLKPFLAVQGPTTLRRISGAPVKS
jgi:competence protein ComEA